MDKYNGTWTELHNRDYFKNHRLYNTFSVVQPHNVNVDDIKGKCVLDIGAGYGRNMGWFCQHAGFVYGLEVCDKIINEATAFLTSKHLKNFAIYPTSRMAWVYDIDYAFCRYVFQHISKEQGREYIDYVYHALNDGGKINFQFRLGEKVSFTENKEPRTEYTVDEVETLLADFKIDNIELTKEHIFILGTKQ